MKIVENLQMELKPDDVKDLIIEYVLKNYNYNVTRDDITIKAGRQLTGYGTSENYIVRFEGISVDCKKESKSQKSNLTFKETIQINFDENDIKRIVEDYVDAPAGYDIKAEDVVIKVGSHLEGFGTSEHEVSRFDGIVITGRKWR